MKLAGHMLVVEVTIIAPTSFTDAARRLRFGLAGVQRKIALAGLPGGMRNTLIIRSP